MTDVLIALIGLTVGSFVNVLVHRLPKNESILRPGSHCPECKNKIRWFDNIPVVSYFILGGNCRHCKTKISFRYPMIELMVMFLFWTTAKKFGFTPLLVVRDWPFMMILVAITFIDLEHRIIPDSLNFGGLVLGLVTSWAVPGFGIMASVSGALVGFVCFYSLAWIYERWTGRCGLGGGDVKLLAMLGAFLGPTGVFCTILISSVTGSILGLTWGMVVRKKNLMTLAIPYGPFLVIGGMFFYLLGDLVWVRFMIPT